MVGGGGEGEGLGGLPTRDGNAGWRGVAGGVAIASQRHSGRPSLGGGQGDGEGLAGTLSDAGGGGGDADAEGWADGEVNGGEVSRIGSDGLVCGGTPHDSHTNIRCVGLVIGVVKDWHTDRSTGFASRDDDRTGSPYCK